MNVLLLVLIVVVLAAAILLGLGFLPKRQTGDSPTRPVLDDALLPAVPSQPAVLLPESPTSADVDALQLSVGLRGYRCDQVDEVLEVLSQRLKAYEDLDERVEPQSLTLSAPSRDNDQLGEVHVEESKQ